jgi:hypothetical protein
MDACFVKLADTDLSDQCFFEENFLHYIHYLYPDKKQKCIDDLAILRTRFKEKDPHTLAHLRDKLESILYRYNQLEHERVNAEIMCLKRV